MNPLVTSIETYTGRYFDFVLPRRDQVDVRDIARGLAHTCRFAGHTKVYYSVAEHALLVARLVKEGGHPPWLQYAALHHDSHEAYIGDIPTPLKRLVRGDYGPIRRTADAVIAEALGLGVQQFHDRHVTEADALALRYEAAVLKRSGGAGEHWGWSEPLTPPAGYVAQCWTPGHAEWQFLSRHWRLREELGLG